MNVAETREAVTGYVQQSLYRLAGTPLNVQAGGAGEAWSMLQVLGSPDSTVSGQVRLRFGSMVVQAQEEKFPLEPLMKDFAYCAGTTGSGLFPHLRAVERRLPDDFLSNLGLSERHFTVGALVLTASVLDVSGVDDPQEVVNLGHLVDENFLGDSSTSRVRTRNVIPASASWLQSLRA